jgi:hypothetical protein
MDATATTKESKMSSTTPAYCDPNNEFRGSNYDATEYMDIADVAKLVRKDIAKAKKAGRLPKQLKVSVTIDRYSMGQSLTAAIKAAPFQIHTDAIQAWYAADYKDLDNVPEKYTAETRQALDVLRGIVHAYNRTNDDLMSDYFDRKFYEHIEVHHDVPHSA